MIKAVIFDCFGVLVRDGWLPFREQYFSHDHTLLEQVVASNKRADAGLQTHADFIREIAALANMSEQAARQQIESNPPNDQLFDWIANLKSNYKIGLLSNSGANWLDELFSPAQLALFDEIVLSYQVGVIKPDPVIYETIAARLGLTPDECLFIDDQTRYCEGAKAVGMQAITYIDNLQLAEELQNYNILFKNT